MQTGEIATVLLDNIDSIIRRWVDELRLSNRTQVHNQLLSAEIVNGVKVILSNLTEAIAQRETPPDDVPSTSDRPGTAGLLASAHSQGNLKSRATRPLMGPLDRALQAAAYHGRLRQNQRYELHELVLEHVKLRQIIWDTLGSVAAERGEELKLDVVPYVDRLLDEVMLTALENFYSSNVRDLEKRAIRDPLTQLYNKDYFQQRLNEELRRALRYRNALTVVMIDVDWLKRINDTYGHQVGDAVIRAVATAIRERSRQSDVPCRYGGDEFAVILPETAKLQARVFAERVARAIQGLSVVVAPGGQPPSMPAEESAHSAHSQSRVPLVVPAPTVSVGIATFPDDARNPETLVATADAALYRAKAQGRSAISF